MLDRALDPPRGSLVFTENVVLLNRVDLLPYLDFPVPHFHAHLSQVTPRAQVIAMSATHGDNLSTRYTWLRQTVSPPPAP